MGQRNAAGRTFAPGSGGTPMASLHAAIGTIPAGWRAVLDAAASSDALEPIAAFVAEERRVGSVLPDPECVFAALDATPYASVRAVILGQDPYPTASHAEGLAFSVPDDVRPLPPSLRNIRVELRSDLGLALPEGGSLAPWARRWFALDKDRQKRTVYGTVLTRGAQCLRTRTGDNSTSARSTNMVTSPREMQPISTFRPWKSARSPSAAG